MGGHQDIRSSLLVVNLIFEGNVVNLILSLFLMYLIVIRFGKIRAAVGRIYSDSTSFISLNLLIVLFFFLGKLSRVVSWYPLVGYVVETV